MSDLPVLGLLCAVVLFGGFSKGVTGLGFPILAIPIAALFMEPRAAIAIISIPTFFTNVMMVRRGGTALPEARRMASLLACGIVGVAIGARALASLPPTVLQLVLGLLAASFVITTILRLRPALSPGAERYLSPLIGVGAGMLQGSTGASGPPLAMYLYALAIPKRSFIVVLGLAFSTFSLAQVISFFAVGLYSPHILTYAAVLTPPSLLGILAGFRVQDRIDQKLFNRAVLAVLGVTAIDLVLRGTHLL